jgi:hypothetical protein
MHISGSSTGNEAWCGLSFILDWIVSYGMYQVFPVSILSFLPVDFHLLMLLLSAYGTPLLNLSSLTFSNIVKWLPFSDRIEKSCPCKQKNAIEYHPLFERKNSPMTFFFRPLSSSKISVIRCGLIFIHRSLQFYQKTPFQ